VRPGVERRSVVALLFAALALFAIGIDWGLPSARGWDFDELVPDFVVSSIAGGHGRAWPMKYPPLQLYLLRPIYRAAMALAPDTWRAGGPEMTRLLFLVSRSVSLLFGLGTVLATFFAARRLFGPRAALFAGAIVTLFVPMVFYSKLGNLDIPYLFWFAASFVVLLRLLESHRRRDYLLVAVCAAAAVATKDQAYGLYVFAPLVLLPSLVTARRSEGRRSPVAGVLLDPRVWIALAGGAAGYVVMSGLALDSERFLQHYRKITGGYAAGYRMFAPTLAGHLENLHLTFKNVEFSFGWPLLVACLAGLGLALRVARRERTLLLLAPPLLAVGYHLSFVSVIGYQYDRYWLPWAVLLAPYGGWALARLAAWRPSGRRLGAAAVALVFGYSLARAATVDVRMVRDSRYAAERWLAEHVAQGESVVGVGDEQMLPRVATVVRWQQAMKRGARLLRDSRPDWMVINGTALWERGSAEFHAGLLAGLWPYDRVARLDRRWRYDLLRDDGITSSLPFVCPPIDIFRRRGDAGDAGIDSATTSGPAEGDAEGPESAEE